MTELEKYLNKVNDNKYDEGIGSAIVQSPVKGLSLLAEKLVGLSLEKDEESANLVAQEVVKKLKSDKEIKTRIDDFDFHKKVESIVHELIGLPSENLGDVEERRSSGVLYRGISNVAEKVADIMHIQLKSKPGSSIRFKS